ncbi:E3 ubiquitin-protein ligase TRIM39-like [Aquarana catesbeiana]|uniref:E3 ubiquitin-protein ligase TRIM39-like n=1 Tax=Aquarana catesbeiana TaxID=8400 RepID=UPI003CC9A776
MASADLRAELECSICLNIYTDPVILKCGHNFCRVCIDRVLDTQEGSGAYFCPVCRKRFRSRPALQRNITLRNIAVHFLSTQPDQEESGVFCTHCVDYPIPAVSSCLRCEVSLCDKHLKKRKLRKVKQKILTKREEMERRVQSLQEHRRKVEEKAAGYTERVTVLFRDLRRRLEDLEKRVLREISGQAEQVSISIRALEIKKEELSRKIGHIEELCNMTDPLTVLQESDTGDLCDTEDGDNEDRERHKELLHDGGGLDVAGVLHTGLSVLIKEVNVYFYMQGAADILLDLSTAGNNLHISDDRKTSSWSNIDQRRPKTDRFTDFPQVLSSQSFPSGQHYWEVNVGGSDLWRVGMCYPSMDRKVLQAGIGRNDKSWGLLRSGIQYSVIHDSMEIPLSANISSNTVRIYLDYEAGRISFYDLCDPIRHLHTFTTTFTEPLHAVLCAWTGCIKICGGNPEK